ncbi:ComEA family DNA-binding protein [Gordonia insulae]|uniref:ComE operon protein 1 n=1 Tax=Gordonia insulae TaxID=2420509 RepID=A0A3G8JEK4_9ACTN|nr:ComEA family DNA-binding protein [Gordonia insulae]AZG43517.1 ComE operon protein 1 [Gordonia insulae]
MSTPARHPRRSALDRLSSPAVESPRAARHGGAVDVDVSDVWSPATDPAEAQRDQPLDADLPPDVAPTPDVGVRPAEDRPWGVTAVPTWLEPIAPHDPSRSRMAIGDRFGAPDPDEPDDDRPRRRFAVAPPAAIALIVIGIVACAVAGLSLLHGGSESTSPVAFPASAGPTEPTPAGQSPPANPAAPSVTSGEMVVSVVGLVRRPGLVRLSGQPRVADAIDRAGGARQGADLLSLNLAQRLNDGDQVLVGYTGGGGRMSLRSAVVGAGGTGGASSGSGSSAAATSSAVPSGAGAKVDLNSATEAQLDELPGVGPVTAKAIVAWRDAHGRFTSVDQLGEVDGIGPTRLAKLRDLVTV